MAVHASFFYTVFLYILPEQPLMWLLIPLSRSEQTYDYSPPEALLNTKWFQGPKRVVQKYDYLSLKVEKLIYYSHHKLSCVVLAFKHPLHFDVLQLYMQSVFCGLYFSSAQIFLYVGGLYFLSPIAALFDRYDMWSVGVVMLELILGSPDVFQLNARTGALLDQHLEGWNEGVKELAYRYNFIFKINYFMQLKPLTAASCSLK